LYDPGCLMLVDAAPGGGLVAVRAILGDEVFQ
jgi:hypothetical protein